ncbi:MAG TPA: 6-hydroxycyclohex-1-ene-1-carbonyl-CoA dehydrogenase [Vicinamibacterales bacterium]|nr:6-hydroxycyclohex-1-ene-1-carbonyl-CoA dehydrogenase [Vicinamibacterales bacterium]
MDFTSAYGFFLESPDQPLVKRPLPELTPEDGEVVVQIAGCGICHTDVGFARDGVPTRHPLPIVLGHEISGVVVRSGRAASRWDGAQVIVPSVIPCGECPACQAGRPTICQRQFMPGNDGHGGFATHVKVPARGLCRVPDALPSGMPLAWLSVVADAVTTPYEAIRRAGLTADHTAVFVGAGGVGGFGVQIAAALGASVVAIDVDDRRLELAARHGARRTINPANADFKSIRAAIRSFVKESGRPGIGLRIFETSGTPAGQQTAFGLLDHGAHLAVVGYTPRSVELKLSNLMAFDATAAGNWGCPPERYPEALALVLDGRVRLDDYVETHPLDCAAAVFQQVVDHSLSRRAILTPEAR